MVWLKATQNLNTLDQYSKIASKTDAGTESKGSSD